MPASSIPRILSLRASEGEITRVKATKDKVIIFFKVFISTPNESDKHRDLDFEA